MKPKFSLILLAYNDEKTIDSALGSIVKQDILKRDISFEVILVPNGCTDSTEQKIDKFINENSLPSDRVNIYKISIKEGHRNKSLNQAITKAKGEIIMYMNADCQISPNTLSEVYDSFTKDNTLYVVGPSDLPILDNIEKDSLLYKMFEGEDILWKIKGKYFPIGRFMAFRKGLVDKFPEDIHSEDIWLDLQAVKKYGLKSVKVLMNTNVYWIPPNSWPGYIELNTRYVHGPNQMMEKYPELKPVFDGVVSKTNPFSREEVIKKVMEELMGKGLSQNEAQEYLQIYKTVRDIIKENERFTSTNLIRGDGTWKTDR